MTKVQTGTGNVYKDLGSVNADDMLVKARLATKIAEIIKYRHLTQTEAASILGMPQPKVSGMLRDHRSVAARAWYLLKRVTSASYRT